MTIHDLNKNKNRRGLVNNIEKLKRPILFNGLQEGNIYPMDIDAVIELHDKYLLLFEVKEQGKPLTAGQSIVLKRIIDSWCRSSVHKKAILFHVTHKPNLKEVELSECLVENYYSRGKWYNVKNKHTVKDMLHAYGEKYKVDTLRNLN